MSKGQFRDVIRKEKLPFNMAQIDFMFDKIDHNQDRFIDFKDWLATFLDDQMNPLQILRDIVIRNNFSQEDILYKLQFRTTDPPLTYAAFKESLKRLDRSLSSLQIKAMFESLSSASKSGVIQVEIPTLLKFMTGEKAKLDFNFKREITLKIQEILRNKHDAMKKLKAKLEEADAQTDGTVEPSKLINILAQLKLTDVFQTDIERYVRQIEKDGRGRINFQKLLLKFENTKVNYPLKAIAIRIGVFLQQNGLTSKGLLDKLIETKNSSKTNKARDKATSELISISFFSKFVKAKVDKKRSVEEIKELVKLIDMDQDGYIGVSDLEAFVGRANYHNFFEQMQKQTNNTIRKTPQYSKIQLQTVQQLEENLLKLSFQRREEEKHQQQLKQLYPEKEYQSKGVENMYGIICAVREGMQAKGLRFPDAWAILDKNSVGLVSFIGFAQGLFEFTSLSHTAKQQLFSLIDQLGIGLISLDQFKDVVNRTQVGLRLLEKDLQKQQNVTFEWEQSIIKRILDWMLEKKYSLTEAFRLIDQDFDGTISLKDLEIFLEAYFKVDLEVYQMKVVRLFKVLDLSKAERIYLADFEKVFSQVFNKMQKSTNARSKTNFQATDGFQINWIESCKSQISRYIQENYTSLDEAFKSTVTEYIRGLIHQSHAIVEMHSLFSLGKGFLNWHRRSSDESEPSILGYRS